MTAWLLSFGWNWLLVPVAVYLAWKFWLATREQPLKYLQHSKVSTQRTVRLTKDHKDLINRWHRHTHYECLEPNEPPQPCVVGQDTWLLDVLRRERMFPWRRHSESWLVSESSSVRESDGALEQGDTHKRFLGMIAVAEARRVETEELSKLDL